MLHSTGNPINHLDNSGFNTPALAVSVVEDVEVVPEIAIFETSDRASANVSPELRITLPVLVNSLLFPFLLCVSSDLGVGCRAICARTESAVGEEELLMFGFRSCRAYHVSGVLAFSPSMALGVA